MKKFFYAALAISAAAAFATSCSKEPVNDDNGSGNGPVTKLDKPVLSDEDQTSTSFTVSWEAVENADSYTYTLNNGTEQATTATSVEFTSLTPGDYTVKVKATSENTSYADSDWAITDVTIAEPVEETFTLDVFVTDEFGSTYGYYSYDSFWFTAKGTGITTASYVCYNYQDGITDDEIIADIESGLAEGSEYIYTLDAEQLALVLTTGITNGFVKLTPESTYELAFYVTFQSGQKKLYRETATTAAAPDASEDIEAWVGTWNITSTKSFQWVEDTQTGYVNPEISDTPKSGTLTIEYDPQYPGSVVVRGFSGVTSLKEAGYDMNLATIENGNLVLNNEFQIAQSQEGSILGWYTYCDIIYGNNQSTASFITGQFPAFTFTLSGNTATSTPGTGSISIDGSNGTFTVVSYDLYEISGMNVSIYHSTTDTSYAGDITLTKTTSSVAPRQAKLFDKAQAVRKSSIPSFSSVKVNFPVMNIM